MKIESAKRLAIRVCSGLIVLALVSAPSAARATEQKAMSEAGFGATAAVASTVYGSIKIVYALGGTLVGSLGWLLSGGRTDVARAVMQPALRGDYVITPEHLAGRRAVRFVGRDPMLEPYELR